MQKRVANAHFHIFSLISKNRNTRFFKTKSVSVSVLGKNRNSVRFFGLPHSSTYSFLLLTFDHSCRNCDNQEYDPLISVNSWV